MLLRVHFAIQMMTFHYDKYSYTLIQVLFLRNCWAIPRSVMHSILHTLHNLLNDRCDHKRLGAALAELAEQAPVPAPNHDVRDEAAILEAWLISTPAGAPPPLSRGKFITWKYGRWAGNKVLSVLDATMRGARFGRLYYSSQI